MKKLLMILILIFTFPVKVICYETNVHRKMTGYAVSSSNISSYLKNDLNINLTDNFRDRTAQEWMEDGSEWEDDNWTQRWLNHFYDPITGSGLTGSKAWGQPSLQWGKEYYSNLWSWKWARNYFYNALAHASPDQRDAYFAKLFRSLGHIAHLVQDLASPAHVRNDPHGAPIINYSMYEDYTKKRAASLSYSGYPAVDISVFNSFDKFWASSGKGLSEYTNTNFFSDDTIFKNYPHPARENTTAKLVEQTARDGKLDKVWYIQGYTSERLAAYSYFWKNGLPPTAEWLYNLDNYVNQDYASQIVPRAVGYSAGLLNYFFRGDVDMLSDNEQGKGYLIVNNSDEDMSGRFELWYDNMDDERKMVWSGVFVIGNKNADNCKSTNIFFPEPSDAKEPGKYMFVFRGNLGNEEDAVVGKIVKLENMKNGIFLITYERSEDPLKQLFFELDIKENRYHLEYLRDYKVQLEGSGGGYPYVTWTVTSDPDNRKHFLTFPGEHIDGIKYYGVIGQGQIFGTDHVWRPGDSSVNSKYQLKYLRLGYGSMDGDYSALSLGRHNYTIDESGKMISFDESIWKNTKRSSRCSGDYVYRYKTENSGLNFVNGTVIDSWYDTPYGDNGCGLPSGYIEPVAVLGGEKVIYVKIEKFPQGQTKTKRNLLWDFFSTSDGCRDLYIGNWYHYHSALTGTIWQEIEKINIFYKGKSTLRYSNYDLESITYYTQNSERDYLRMAGYDVSNMTSERWDTDGPCDPTYTSSPDTIDINLDPVVSQQERVVMEVLDYDNREEDSFILIYDVSKSVTSSITSGVHYTCSVFPWGDSGPLRSCEEFYGNSITTIDLSKKYYLVYKTSMTSDLKKELIHEEIASGENYALVNNVLTGFSTQMSKDIMVYTFIIKKHEGTDYVFDKRILGIINISDPRLPKGYRQEFVINSETFSIEAFDYTLPGAIGIHRMK